MFTIKRIGSICFLVLSIAATMLAQGRNSIEGRVTGPSGNGIADARVTLQNTNRNDIGQDITDASGGYRFYGLGDGTYYIEVEPLGTGYERKSLRLSLASLSGRGGDVYHVDFQLRLFRPAEKPLPKKLADFLTFVQDIPPAALQQYKDAQKLFEKEKKEEAYASLRRAIETFPDYYDALDLLGTEYTAAGWFGVAVPLFLQATDVNPKGWHAFYGLGVAYSSLNMKKDSIAAFRKSMDLNSFHPATFFRLGNELAKDGSLEEAIKIFQNAIKLDSGELSEVYAALAAIYSRLDRYTEAADALESYAKSVPELKNPEAVARKVRELRKKANPPKTN